MHINTNIKDDDNSILRAMARNFSDQAIKRGIPFEKFQGSQPEPARGWRIPLRTPPKSGAYSFDSVVTPDGTLWLQPLNGNPGLLIVCGQRADAEGLTSKEGIRELRESMKRVLSAFNKATSSV